MIPELAKHTEKLIYFFEIVQEGSLQATSRKLGVSAPTLSYAMKELERTAGVTLFQRSKKGMALTTAGERLFVFCRKLYRDIDDVQMQMSNLSIAAKRKVRIGTFQSIAIYFWPLLLDQLKKEIDLSISITTNRSKNVLEALVRKEIDIAITVGATHHSHVIKHELYRDEYSFYTAVKNKKSNFKKSDIRDHALIYIPDAEDEFGKNLRSHVHSWGLIFHEEFELDSFEVIGEFVKNGYGIGILPTRVAKGYKNDIKEIKIEGPPTKRFCPHSFFLSYRNDIDMSQKILKLILEDAHRAVQQMSGE